MSCKCKDEVTKLELKPGNTLWIRLGIFDLGDGQGPWIPTPEERENHKKEWEKIVPEGVNVHVTHFGTEATVLA